MSDNKMEQPLRINKYLTLSGVDSRRVADELIAQGRVSVNGTVITQPGMKIQPGDFVRLDDKRVEPLPITTILLNKPRGFICSRKSQGETDETIYELLPPGMKHLTYAGRLDADSEGLLIMTNDGELNQKITHPTEGIEKEYWVTLDQSFDNSVLTQLLRGVTIPEGFAKAKYVTRASSRRAHIVLEQGFKRQIRQMFACLGLRVTKLVRVRIGSLWGGDLEPGRWSLLTEEDLKLALQNPPPPKDWFTVDTTKALPKHKPGREGGPLHPGQGLEREPRKAGPMEFKTNEFSRRNDESDKPDFRSRSFDRPERRFDRNSDSGGRRDFRPRFRQDNEFEDRGRRNSFPRNNRGSEDRPFENRRFRDNDGPRGSFRDRENRFNRDSDFGGKRDFRRNDRPDFRRNDRSEFRGNDRPDFRRNDRPDFRRNDRPDFRGGDRPDFRSRSFDRPERRFDRNSDSGERRESRFNGKPDFKSGFNRRFDDNGPRKFGPRRRDDNAGGFARGGRGNANPSFRKNDRGGFGRGGNSGGFRRGSR